MNPRTSAMVQGLRRGLTEFRYMLTTREDVVATVFFGLFPLAALVFFDRQDTTMTIAGVGYDYLLFVTPGMFAVVLAFSVMSPMHYLAAEREDGTLLRMRAAPRGLTTYTVGRTVSVSLEAVLGLSLVLVPAVVMFDGLAAVDVAGWLQFVGVFLLGLLAVQPLGMLIGSLLRSVKGIFSIGIAVIAALTVVSGIYQPLEAFPGWLQVIAQSLPVYWIAHGMRHALLPDVMAVAEVGGAWRPVATVLVLLAWAVIGGVLAPLALRRTARRETGSTVLARREAALQRSV